MGSTGKQHQQNRRQDHQDPGIYHTHPHTTTTLMVFGKIPEKHASQ
jgi:hypothetical protein